MVLAWAVLAWVVTIPVGACAEIWVAGACEAVLAAAVQVAPVVQVAADSVAVPEAAVPEAVEAMKAARATVDPAVNLADCTAVDPTGKAGAARWRSATGGAIHATCI